jgi:murein DD-endopeptidase MepM/ murein hydrolase activator NlpD
MRAEILLAAMYRAPFRSRGGPGGKVLPSLCFLLMSAILSNRGFAQTSPYPEIKALHAGDIVYDQLMESVEQFHRSEKSSQTAPALSIYSYVLPRDTDVFELSAALSLSYDTVVSINRIPNPETIAKGQTILVPSLPGVFVSESPENDLEYLMKSLRAEERGFTKVHVAIKGRYVDFLFYPGSEFHASERSFFLIAGFRFPLSKGIISSGFGMRTDPFNGRIFKFHPGIDIAAPSGSDVYAARGGRVEFAGWSDVYGNYVRVVHDNHWETLYGHLSKILVVVNQTVKTGELLGLVGSTGLSTGPHLHFEIRKQGVAEDPSTLMMGQQR